MLRSSGEVLSNKEREGVGVFVDDGDLRQARSDSSDISEEGGEFSSERTEQYNQAANLISQHYMAMQVTSEHERDVAAKRDACLSYLDKQRESEFFQTVKQAVLNGDKVSAAEYYYFALTADDIKLIDLDLLDAALGRFEFSISRVDGDAYHNYSVFNMGQDDAFAVLQAALLYQRAEDKEDKEYYEGRLNDAIRSRQNHFGNLPSCFVNLAGMDISGANLANFKPTAGRSSPALSMADLRKANFAGCNMTYIAMAGCDVSGACFADVASSNNAIDHGPRIRSSIAREANFDRFAAAHLMWRGSDFTGSTFKGAKLYSGRYDKSLFDNCDFEGALLNFREYETRDCSIKNANLTDAKVISPNCLHNDFSGVRFLAPTAMKDVAAFKAGLDAVMSNVTEVSRIPWMRSAFQEALAQDIARCIKEKDMPKALQAKFFDAAIDHAVFHVNETFKEQVAGKAKSVVNTAGTMFGCCGTFYSANKAISYLEHERDDKSLEVENTLSM